MSSARPAGGSYAECIIETVREPLLFLYADLRVKAANRAFYQTFRVSPRETEGRFIFELGNRQWDIPRLRMLLRAVLAEGAQFAGFEVEHDFPTVGRKVMLLNARRVLAGDSHPETVLLALEDVTARKRAEEELRRLNQELEERVRERTAELEAFSYSVAHDLRAPLRAVDGFSLALVEDFGPQLPAEAQRYLDLVRQNTRQMGHLVDDLLAFARLGRQAIRKQTVNPADVVREALEDLRAEREGRRVEITVGELPPCRADPVLLRQVFVNLLSNAMKFTRRREVARIEVSCRRDAGSDVGPDAGRHVYFVRDNGVGFDTRYAHKLFGVFQRLHRAEEYEGTGVGLAIVQRVVHRHGGRAWAEAELDKGATVYFTIESATAGSQAASPEPSQVGEP